jgi:anaerobic ribonucleoside-triphosphate reductase activating protein
MSHESPKFLPDPPRVRLAGFAAESRVNGPGRRVVIWVQGCTLACPGCFNPDTHPAAGASFPAADLARRVVAARSPATDGLTLSGGEPFQQAIALAEMCAAVRSAWPQVSLMAFTGYTLEALRGPEAPPGSNRLLASLDLLVDGPFEARHPDVRPWRGSANQRLWVLGRRPATPVPERARAAEIHVEPDGRVLLSGFPDSALRRAIEQLAR